MILKTTILDYRLTLSFAKITRVVGVNSNLPDGKHILMWDFDDVELPDVANELRLVQSAYKLPRITLLWSGTPNHWLAYCFKSCSWLAASRIVNNTNHVDRNFYKYSVYREHFTLRVTPKHQREIKFWMILESPFPEDCNVDELRSFVKYQTL